MEEEKQTETTGQEPKKSYVPPEIVRVDLEVDNWKGYIAAGCGSACCLGSVAAGGC
jgi:hypothetical protein